MLDWDADVVRVTQLGVSLKLWSEFDVKLNILKQMEGLRVSYFNVQFSIFLKS